MGFVADKVVEPLAWDFTTYGGGQGVSPEPTTQQIERYFRRQRNIVEALLRIQTAEMDKESSRLTKLTPEQAQAEVQRWAELTHEEAFEILETELAAGHTPEGEKLHRKYSELIAETTHDCPNLDQLMALPHRIRTAYFGWFTGQLINPEPVAAGTKPSLSLVRGE